MSTLSEQVRRECLDILDADFGTLVQSTIQQNQSNEFIYTYFDDEGINSLTLSSEIQEPLHSAMKELTRSYNVESSDLTVAQKGVKWFPQENVVKPFVVIRYSTETDANLFSDAADKFSSLREQVSKNRIVSIECEASIRPSTFVDSTIVYETKEPHKRIGNIETLEEYIEKRAERTGETEDKLKKQEYYEDHFHMTNKSTIVEQICTETANLWKDEYLSITGDISVTPTSANLSRDGCVNSAVTIHATTESLIGIK